MQEDDRRPSSQICSEISLMEQAFVKNPDSKVGKLLQEANAEVVQFARFEVGEGLRKRKMTSRQKLLHN